MTHNRCYELAKTEEYYIKNLRVFGVYSLTAKSIIYLAKRWGQARDFLRGCPIPDLVIVRFDSRGPMWG